MSVIPTAEEFLNQQLPFLRPLARFLADGSDEARVFFKDLGRPVDAILFPHLVRYQCKLALGDLGISADEFLLTVEKIANNGLSFFADCNHYRVFKTQNGEIPPPGDSEVKQDFYQQMSFREVPDSNGTLAPVELNIVILWQVDSSHKLEHVHIVCPRRGGIEKDSVEYHWRVKAKLIYDTIQHPSNDPDGGPSAGFRDLEFYSPEGPNYRSSASA